MATAVPTTPGDPAQPPPPPAAEAVKPPNNLVGLALLAAFISAGLRLTQAHDAATGILTFAFVMLGWALSVMAHEFAHALVAWLGGDHTVKDKGYLAFDPRRYGDLGTSLILPLIFLALGGIGFPGGAVYLRMDLMRGPVWRAASALAGPAATLIVLAVIAFAVRAMLAADAIGPLLAALAFLGFLQATALILNLLPVPGLDGFGAIRPFLPESWAPGLRKFEGLATVAVFLLIFLSPVGGAFLFGGGMALAGALGVPIALIRDGYAAFHFWR